MKPIKSAGLALIAASLISASQAAGACEKRLLILQDALNSSDYDGICANQGELRAGKLGKSNCEGLNDKIEAVLDKLDEGELRDAAWIIDDFGEALRMLTFSSEAAISVESYTSLVTPKFIEAASCVKLLRRPGTD